MATIKYLPRIDKTDKQGLCPIQIVIQNKGSRVYHMVPTVKIKPEDWDYENNEVKSSVRNYQFMNRLIVKKVMDVQRIVMDMEFQGQGFNKDILRSKLNGYDDKNFYDFWESVIKTRDSNITAGTRRIYLSNFNKIKEFRRTLTFQEITLDFLESFESWMRTEKKNKPNTIQKAMKTIKYMVNRAEATLGITNKAFAAYKMPGEVTFKDVINLENLDCMLDALYSERFKTFGGKTQEILATFCFQALSGLRFGDAVAFNPISSIKDGNIKLYTDKTGKDVYIPIHDRLRRLLEYQKYSFNPGTNQASNRVIKAIALSLQIPCKVTTHTAVHSFCTISLELGIPLEVISRVRGHANIKTTQIYTQVKNTLIEEQMKKWNKIGKQFHSEN